MSRREIELAERLRAGDETALAEIAAELFPRVAAWLAHAFHDRLTRADVEDVMQEASLMLWLNREKLDPARDALRPWVTGFAKNAARKHSTNGAAGGHSRAELPDTDGLDILAWNQHEIERPAGIDADGIAQDKESPRESFRRECLPVMREMLAILSEQERAALLATDAGGIPISNAQAAERLGINANTFRSHLSRARAKIERECERRGFPKPNWRDWDRDGC